MKFGCFAYNGEEYVQHRGLAMGSPLSPVAACLFLETLEEAHYLKILEAGSIWLRYVDDVLVVVPRETDLKEKLRKLNEVHENIQFTLEEEKEERMPFLDTCIIRTPDRFKFKVFRKPTNKEDYVHFYSAHSERTKSGIVIGFFLRAYRICDKEFLEEEFAHIYKAFEKLKYPKGFLIQQRRKAERITKRSSDKRNDKQRKNNTRWITIPNSAQAETISRTLEKSNIKVATNTGTKIQEMVTRTQRKDNTNEKSVVYEIPCKVCDQSYVGETGRGVQVRLKEHRSDVKFHRTSNALVLHIEKYGHLPDWDNTRILEKNMKKSTRKMLEAAHIITRKTCNSRCGFITWSSMAAKLGVG